MMQLVVPETLSFPCAKLVKAMAALISFQYVSSLPFTFSFCVAATPPLPLTITRRAKHAQREHKQKEHQRSRSAPTGESFQELQGPLTCHIYLIHGRRFLKAQVDIKGQLCNEDLSGNMDMQEERIKPFLSFSLCKRVVLFSLFIHDTGQTECFFLYKAIHQQGTSQDGNERMFLMTHNLQSLLCCRRTKAVQLSCLRKSRLEMTEREQFEQE